VKISRDLNSTGGGGGGRRNAFSDKVCGTAAVAAETDLTVRRAGKEIPRKRI